MGRGDGVHVAGARAGGVHRLIPAALYLIAIDSYGKAVFILIYGLLTTLADNVFKPLIIRGGSKIHPVVIFFSILGGLAFTSASRASSSAPW